MGLVQGLSLGAVATTIGILTQAAGMVWWVATLKATVNYLARRVAELEKAAEETAKAVTGLTVQQARLDEREALCTEREKHV